MWLNANSRRYSRDFTRYTKTQLRNCKCEFACGFSLHIANQKCGTPKQPRCQDALNIVKTEKSNDSIWNGLREIKGEFVNIITRILWTLEEKNEIREQWNFDLLKFEHKYLKRNENVLYFVMKSDIFISYSYSFKI